MEPDIPYKAARYDNFEHHIMNVCSRENLIPVWEHEGLSTYR
jgi:hypothetical protein